jgi:hypothetical protein
MTANLVFGTPGANALGLVLDRQGSVRIRRNPTPYTAVARQRFAKG